MSGSRQERVDQERVQERVDEERVEDLAAAIEVQRAKLAEDPSDADAHHNLALSLIDGGQPSLAILHLTQALRLRPGSVASLLALGIANDSLQNVSAAQTAFATAAKGDDGNQAIELRGDAIGPNTPASNDAIDHYLVELDATLDRHLERGSDSGSGAISSLSDEDLLAANAFPRFSLSYLGRDVRPILQKWASIYEPRFSDSQPDPGGSGLTDRKRIGMLVSPGHEGLVANKRMHILNRLDPEKFEVVVFCGQAAVERLRSATTSPALSVQGITDELEMTRQVVRDARCDLLVYRECGTAPHNYFLAFSRLAPVQALETGTPYTSGIASIDHYLSSTVVEPKGAQAYYVEELIQMNEVPWFEPAPSLPSELRSKADFGIDSHQSVIVCAQNPLKMHPDFDEIVADVLRAAPHTILVCFAKMEAVMNKVKQRMQRTIPDVVDRIHWVEAQSSQDYFSLLAVADVCIDTPHYNGMNITFDAFAVGTPVISGWGDWMRSRFTAALANAMDLPAMIADTPLGIGHVAARLVNDRDELTELSARLVERREVVFERHEAVTEFDRYFEAATGL